MYWVTNRAYTYWVFFCQVFGSSFDGSLFPVSLNSTLVCLLFNLICAVIARVCGGAAQCFGFFDFQVFVKMPMNEVGVAACRYSIRHLYDVITAFDDVKRTLVEAIGFGGLLEFPAVRQINRQFSVWLMSKVNHSSHEIVLDPDRILRFSKEDVAVVFGIPCTGNKVLENGVPSIETVQFIASEFLGFVARDCRSIRMVKEVIVKDYGGVMSAREQDAFKAAFVVYVMSTLLAPGAKYDYAAVDYWNAIVDPSKISCYDWGDYVVHRLMDAVVKVKADIRKGIKACNITGCCLFLQVLLYMCLVIFRFDILLFFILRGWI